jgi:mRNA-degrading endonuclease toxin of MazEF toxin-antitoxin module
MTVSRGEIYYAGMPNHPKQRPAVILTANWLSRHSLDVMVVPITSVERPPFPTRVELRPCEKIRGHSGLASWKQ